MNTQLDFLVVLVLITLTALLTATFYALLPMVMKRWNAFISRIKRDKIQKTRLQKPYQLLQLELTALDKKVSELEEQMNNVAQNSYRREQNRKSNVRRVVREYLAELRDEK